MLMLILLPDFITPAEKLDVLPAKHASGDISLSMAVYPQGLCPTDGNAPIIPVNGYLRLTTVPVAGIVGVFVRFTRILTTVMMMLAGKYRRSAPSGPGICL